MLKNKTFLDFLLKYSFMHFLLIGTMVLKMLIKGTCLLFILQILREHNI